MYTHNSDLNYYLDFPIVTNCGSYALRLKEWFDPFWAFAKITGLVVSEWIEEKWEEGFSDFEISCLYGDVLTEYLLKEFDGELEICENKDILKAGTELIALNTYCTYDDDSGPDYDFHFKVLRDGVWKEKCGYTQVTTCEEYNWSYGDFEYIGEPIYFYHKVN